MHITVFVMAALVAAIHHHDGMPVFMDGRGSLATAYGRPVMTACLNGHCG